MRKHTRVVSDQNHLPVPPLVRVRISSLAQAAQRLLEEDAVNGAEPWVYADILSLFEGLQDLDTIMRPPGPGGGTDSA